jgi:DNA-binding NtrC family response regulator
VIVVTAKGVYREADEEILAAAYAKLVKPFGIAELLGLVAKASRERQ